jgi:hypothetical protein
MPNLSEPLAAQSALSAMPSKRQRWRTPVGCVAMLETSPSSRGFLALLTAFSTSGGTTRGDILAQLLQEHRANGRLSLARMLVSGQVFSFPWRNHIWLPMFQFSPEDLSPKPGPRAVRAVLEPFLQGWSLAAWFGEPHAHLNGQRPVDLLDTQLDAVLDAAHSPRG